MNIARHFSLQIPAGIGKARPPAGYGELKGDFHVVEPELRISKGGVTLGGVPVEQESGLWLHA